MRTWAGIASAFLVMIGLHSAAWANSELHTGGRLFFPLWDVSTPNRLTMIVVTRQALREDQRIIAVSRDETTHFVVDGEGKCLPRGTFGSTTNVNRTDLGGTPTNPVFVDDVHFEYYGRSCKFQDEIVHMSCGDVDLILLASPDNAEIKPRLAFDSVAGDGRGALDVHFTTNGQPDPRNRKLENSLMGHAIITDLAQGWVASYDAAPAKAFPCELCEIVDGGEPVGYENYPREAYLPVAFADGFPSPGGGLRNVLSLWGPALLPGGNLNATSIDVQFKWWDGRERAFISSVISHSVIRPLGGNTIAGLDPPLDPAKFNVANFVCGHTVVAGQAENDGFPRSGTDATACGAPDVPDIAHPSDNFENTGDLNIARHRIQPSTPLGHWRFRLLSDGNPPAGVGSSLGAENIDHSGRGLVGVVLSAPPAKTRQRPGVVPPHRVGDAVRLWHEDPCELAQSGLTFGPPHVRDKLFQILEDLEDPDPGKFIAFFNVHKFAGQEFLCAL